MYSKAKSYRVISLLNCLDKVVEKVVATMISEHCGREGTLHPGQNGSCKRSAVDVVGVLMAEVQHTWGEGRWQQLCAWMWLRRSQAWHGNAMRTMGFDEKPSRVDEQLHDVTDKYV